MAAMMAISRKKGFPVLRTLGILGCIGGIVWGLTRVLNGGSGWFVVCLFLCSLPGYVIGLRNQIVRIIVDDEAIRFLRRNGTDFTIARSAVIDSEPGPKRIRIRHHGLPGICSATLPLRRFSPEDTESLRAEFSGKEMLQEAARLLH